MRKISKIKRSVRAVSPVISTILMISIVVIASIVAYVFVVGFVGGKTENAGNGIQVQSLASKSNLVVYVQNTGQGIVHLREHGSIYVNDFPMKILRVDDKNIQEVIDQKGLIPIKVGQTIAVTVNYLPQPDEQLKIKIVTVEGTSMQSSGKPHFSFAIQVPITFMTNPVGAGTIDQQSKDYPVGAIIPITATAYPGYVFASWTYTGYIEINNPTSASTDAQIINPVTVTANFIPETGSKLTFTSGSSQTIYTNELSSTITITRQDASNNPITTGNTNIEIQTTASSGNFYNSEGTQITSITINSPASSNEVYYKDTAAGTPTLKATTSDQSYSSISTTFTIKTPTPTQNTSPTIPPTDSPTPSPKPTEEPTTTPNPCPTTSPLPTSTPTTSPSQTPTSTPTTTPHPSPSPHPTQPPCTTPTPTPTTTPKPTTEHNSHFDEPSDNWNQGWDYWTHSPWKVATDKCYDIQQSVKSTSSNQGHFTCNPIDASDAKYITVTFKYMTHQTQPTNFHTRYSGSVTDDYCNVAWKTLGENGANLGDNSKCSPDQWHEYKVTITDISAFTNNFRLSFLSQDLNSRAAIWIDNVQITICK
jgi:outer membrane biosynthesis protein TonB